MKKTKLTRSLLAACSIVALSAVMYGCTHSSGPSQTDLDVANEATAAAEAKAEVDAAAAATAAEEAAAASATAATAAEEAAAASATAAEEAAAASATAAEEAAAAAATAAEEAATAAATAAEEAATAAATAAEEAATAAATAADAAEAARQAAQDEADRLQGALDAAAAAKASDDAKELLNMALVDVSPTADVDPVTAPTATLSVSNDGMLMAEATDYTMADMAPDMIEGWRGAMLTNVGGDTAVVYSDIGNDGTVSLLDRYTSNLPTATSPRSWNIGVDGNVPWSEVRRPDEMTTAGGASDNPIAMFTGTVHGIPGTFSCDVGGAGDAALCGAPVTYSDGKVNAAGVVAGHIWMFTPDEGANTYTDDTDYLVFGWWLDKGADGKPDHARLITTAPGWGAARSTENTGGALRGAATYEGAAAGKYAMASAAEDTHEGGHFTAMATLMVDFDADLVSAVDDGGVDIDDNVGVALSGTIDNFMTGDTSRPDWSVTLMVDGTPDVEDNAATAGAQPLEALVDGTSTMTTKWSTGAAQTGTGMWTAVWYGGLETELPTAVTGTFNAHIGTADGDSGAIARLQGAFGANMADE